MGLGINNLSQLFKNIIYLISIIVILFGICFLIGIFIDINGGGFEDSFVPIAHLYFCIKENIFGFILLLFMSNNLIIFIETIILLIIHYILLHLIHLNFHIEIFNKNIIFVITNIISIILVFIVKIINNKIIKKGSNCT